MWKRRPWKEELAIIDRAMRAISGISDPEEMVSVYWQHIGQLVSIDDYVALSRRDVNPPAYLITRSSRFVEEFNPWTQRDRLPLLTGGILGELAYADRPMHIDDLPARLTPDDPGRFYLEGFDRLVAFPQYDNGDGLNVTAILFPPGAEIDPSMIPMLHWQSGLFGRGTQNLVLRNQLAKALENLDSELKSVGQIQRQLLPETLPSIPKFDVAAFYQTSARAGGDYYDFFQLDGNGGADAEWGLFIADVSGHGTPAAVIMAITHAIAHAHPSKHTPPEALLRVLNDRLTRTYTRGGTFVTAFYAVLNPVTRELTYSRAGHNPPRLVRGDRVISLEDSAGLPLGIFADQPYDQITVKLERGDLLVLYTDGITEAAAPRSGNESRELFDLERLDRVLLDCGVHTAEGCIERVREAVAVFSANAPPTDDRTLIAMRCL